MHTKRYREFVARTCRAWVSFLAAWWELAYYKYDYTYVCELPSGWCMKCYLASNLNRVRFGFMRETM